MMKRLIGRIGKIVLMLGISLGIASQAGSSSTTPIPNEQHDETAKARLQETYGKLPLYFIKNDGQMDKKVVFYEKSSGHATFFTQEGVYLNLTRRSASSVSNQSGNPGSLPLDRTLQESKQEPQSSFIKLSPVGANKHSKIVAEGVQEGKVNYFTGNDPKKWKTNIPTYQAVVYHDLYPGIDMKFYGNNRQMEYDIIVKPGADPSQVRLAYEEIEALRVTEDGNLEIGLKEGKLIQKKPVIYQEIEGKRVEVAGKFRIQNSNQFAYSFEVASYDKNHLLIIDPTLIYSTYLGGNGIDEGLGIAVDTSGAAYITGYTGSTTFPTASPLFGFGGGEYDAFVTKINAAGTGLVYSTYLGGSNSDYAYRIAVDSSGAAYIVGDTSSTNFPTATPIQGIFGGSSDVFIVKINASGNSLVYSTYLGGGSEDDGYAITVDASGNAYVTGSTRSTDFPTANPFQASFGGGLWDAFVAKLNATGSALVYSTYLGGSATLEDGRGIAVDNSGNAYIVGETNGNFPLWNPIQATYMGGGGDVFVTKLNSVGNALVYSTYLGGSGEDTGFDITVDASGAVYITGRTLSTNFPTASPIQGSNAGGWDAFVTKLNVTGNALVYSTYLGGSGDDTRIEFFGGGIAVDAAGNAYIAGITNSTNFPTAFPIQGNNAGGRDAFITKINAAGTGLVYSTYLGGSGDDDGLGIAVDTFGNAFITGTTYSTNFPLVSPIQGAFGGSYTDAFVAKIRVAADLSITKSDSPDPVTAGNNLTYTVTVTNNGPDAATGVVMTDTLPNGVAFVSATPTQGSCTQLSGVITCNLSSIANAASATTTIVVTAMAVGTINNSASTAGNETDPNLANNTANAGTTVSNTSVVCGGVLATIVGTNGADTITGTAGNDVISGLAGNDIISGLGGDDTFCGDTGIDTINGGDGNDTLTGGGDNDTLNGEAGNDQLFGAAGNDAMNGGTGTDFCNGGPGTGDTAVNCETVTNVP